MKHISIEEFDQTIAGQDYTDTSVFDPEDVAKQVEQEAIEAGKMSEKPKVDARRRVEMLKEHKDLNSELCDVYDDFLNS